MNEYMKVGDYLDAVQCVCGNDVTTGGFSPLQLAADGTVLSVDPADPVTHFVCGGCGKYAAQTFEPDPGSTDEFYPNRTAVLGAFKMCGGCGQPLYQEGDVLVSALHGDFGGTYDRCDADGGDHTAT